MKNTFEIKVTNERNIRRYLCNFNTFKCCNCKDNSTLKLGFEMFWSLYMNDKLVHDLAVDCFIYIFPCGTWVWDFFMVIPLWHKGRSTTWPFGGFVLALSALLGVSWLATSTSDLHMPLGVILGLYYVNRLWMQGHGPWPNS